MAQINAGDQHSKVNRRLYKNGKNFCLRGGAEQRGLKMSQFHKDIVHINGRDVSSYVYYEFGSKNCQGGVNSLNSDNKSVRQHENTDMPFVMSRSWINICKIPNEARSADNFYLTSVAVLLGHLGLHGRKHYTATVMTAAGAVEYFEFQG